MARSPWGPMLGRSEQVLVKATWGWAGGVVAPGAPATWLWVLGASNLARLSLCTYTVEYSMFGGK